MHGYAKDIPLTSVRAYQAESLVKHALSLSRPQEGSASTVHNFLLRDIDCNLQILSTLGRGQSESAGSPLIYEFGMY